MSEYAKEVQKKVDEYQKSDGITTEINKIKGAKKGVEVRGALASGLQKAYDDASKDGNANMEVELARGVYNVLNDRLNASDEKLANKVTKQELQQGLSPKADQSFVDAQFASIVSGAPKGTFANLQALKDAYPDGEEGVFLVLSDGNWYYWNEQENQWLAGGLYQAVSIQEFMVKEGEPF